MCYDSIMFDVVFAYLCGYLLPWVILIALVARALHVH